MSFNHYSESNHEKNQPYACSSRCILHGGGAAHAAHTWNGPDSETPLQVKETLGSSDIPGGSFFYYTFANGSSGVVNNVNVDLTTTDTVGNQIFTVELLADGLEIAGDTFNVSLTTDAVGTGNSMAAGLDIESSSATISAKNTSISVIGTSTNGKAIYGIAAWAGTDVDFTGDTVNVNVQTATDRGDNPSQYS